MEILTITNACARVLEQPLREKPLMMWTVFCIIWPALYKLRDILISTFFTDYIMDWKTCQLKLSVSSIKDTQPSVHQRHFHYFPEKTALFVRFYILNFFCQYVLIVLRYRFIRDSGNSEKLKTFVSSYVTTIKFTIRIPYSKNSTIDLIQNSWSLFETVERSKWLPKNVNNKLGRFVSKYIK